MNKNEEYVGTKKLEWDNSTEILKITDTEGNVHECSHYLCFAFDEQEDDINTGVYTTAKLTDAHLLSVTLELVKRCLDRYNGCDENYGDYDNKN